MPQQDPQGHRATLRVLAILDALAHNGHGLTMAEICRELDAPKSSLFPILHTMANADYIRYDEDTGRYGMGLKSYLLGKAFDREGSGLAPIEATMRDVVDACGETCQLGVLDHGRVLYVARVDSPQPIRLASEIGKTLPAQCTAIGKAILSEWDDASVREALPEPLERPTEKSAASIDEVLAQLEIVRHEGFAHDNQEIAEGAECIAVPIAMGGSHYGLGVTIPAYRLDTEKEELVIQALKKARHHLAQISG